MRSLLSAIDLQLAPPPDPGRVGWLGEWTYAHRGLHGGDIPENTLLGFAAAADIGLGIECDIQRSSDGQAMVFHDWDVDRLTEGRGNFGEFTSEFLERLKYRGAAYGIARLVQLLEIVDGRVPILIEIKSKARYDIVKSCLAVSAALSGYDGKHAVMSFDPRVSRWLREHSPQTVRGLVMREDHIGFTPYAWQRHLALWHARPDFIAYDVRTLPNRFVSGLRDGGMPVVTWTVDTPEKMATARRHADAPIAEGEGLA